MTGRDAAGDVKVKGLTKAERDAIDIVSVRAIGQADLGVLVTATFRGNFEKAVGRGHLKTALAALVLIPKSGAGAPAGVVTQGAGPVGKILRRTRSAAVGAVRHGKSVTFFVAGPGYENVASVEVRTLAKAPAPGRTLAQDKPPTVSDRYWREILVSPKDRAFVIANVDQLTCQELKSLVSELNLLLTELAQVSASSYAPTSPTNEWQRQLKTLRDDVRQALFSPPCGTGSGVDATLVLRFFDPTEVTGTGKITGPASLVVSDLRVVLPEKFTIVNQLCPNQLPSASVHGSTIDCTGGALHPGQQFTINLRTVPRPTVGMGGDLLLIDEPGNQYGPFTITGP